MDFNNNKAPQSEEIIFYLDLSTEFLKRKNVIKAIDDFIENKAEISKNISYGLVLFKKGKEIFSLYNKSAERIIDTIEDIWDEREEDESYFENGLYEILAHIFKVSRNNPKKYQVIILSDSVSHLSDDYHTALYNLILKAKNFSTTINVIRLGEDKFYEDDVKLKVITSETFGATFYCDNRKNVDTYLNSLLKTQESINILKSESQKVLDDDYSFYEKLATDLISLSSEDDTNCILCEQELCPICETHSDELHKCYNCDAPFHSCCAAEYSISNQIGFPNIFRCPRCGALLKLDKNFVDTILSEKSEQEEVDSEQKENILEQYMSKEDFKQDIIDDENIPFRPPSKKKVKVGGFFGTEIEINSNGSSNNKTKPGFAKSEDKDEKMSITSLKPPRSKSSLKLCPICGATVKGSIFCPICGSKIEK
ncbi:MAG: hypothetical protein GF311_09485 [Candidatus Lokiarchaeota archaeon]|nr:hypothetical protein [Candidatus Lokiarchaeota archaeon]